MSEINVESMMELHTAVHSNPSKLVLPPDWEERALKAEANLAALELVVVCAQDIVKAWPTLTMRLLGRMTNRIDTLRQALEASQK